MFPLVHCIPLIWHWFLSQVTKLRKECPNEMCGPGVFMAMHYNRYYCGKCALTYVIKKDEE